MILSYKDCGMGWERVDLVTCQMVTWYGTDVSFSLPVFSALWLEKASPQKRKWWTEGAERGERLSPSSAPKALSISFLFFFFNRNVIDLQHCVSFPLFFNSAAWVWLAARRMFFLVAACGIEFPDQGLNPRPLHWELGALATGPPGKYLLC